MVIVIGLLLAGAALLLFVRKPGFSDGEHEPFQAALWQTKQLDTTFKENLLRARFSMLQTYDDFEINKRDTEDALAQLSAVPGFVGAPARAAMAQSIAGYRALLQTRERLVERFKSQNAVLVNSRRYLPVVIQELSALKGAGPADRELHAAVEALDHALLFSQLSADAATGLDGAESLKDWLVRHPGHAGADLASSLERHASTLMSQDANLDAVINEILALPTTPGIENLFRIYEAEVVGALGRAQQYRTLLYVVLALLVAAVGHILRVLRTTNRELERRVDERTRALSGSEQRFRTLAAEAPVGIYLTDANGACVYTNARWQAIAGLSADEALGEGWLRALHPEDAKEVIADWARTVREGNGIDREFRFQTPAGIRLVHAQAAVVRSENGEILGYVGTAEDITERRRVAVELQQAQKLESVGRLAAGVAHEINTPVQYVSDNCHFVKAGLADLGLLIDRYRETLRAIADGSASPQTAAARLQSEEEQADLEYLLGNMPRAIDSSLEGLQRVAIIVQSMKEFAHPDQAEMVHAEINQAIESTLTVARGEYKYVADVKTEFGDLPLVPCYLGELNQAVLNIVVNAAHAIEDVVKGTGRRGLITVRTVNDGDAVSISIADTGTGIPEHIRSRIFDPFFTTKEVGRGTGQGLAIARSVVVDKHRGSLSVDTQPGQGTTFTIRLPVLAAGPLETSI